MRSEYGPVLTLSQAQSLISERVPWTPSTRTLQRWVATGRHGGFRSRTTGRALFHTGQLMRALRPRRGL